MNIVSLILKLCSLGLVICAAGFWAGAGVDARSKNRDEQILVGGTIWSQTLIPIGLIISAIVDDGLDTFVHAYYLFVGWILLGVAGVLVIVDEASKLKKRRQPRVRIATSDIEPPQLCRKPFEIIFFGIGVLLLSASIITFVDFVVNIVIE